jgi:hypothetical protein
MLDKILYVVDESVMPLQLLRSVLSPFISIGRTIDSFHSSGNISFIQIELISCGPQSESFYSLLGLIPLGFDQYLVICLFSFSVVISNSKALGSGASGSVVHISICLTSLIACTFNSLEKWFLYLAKVL